MTKYKKIEITPTGEIIPQRKTKTFSAIKNACSAIKKGFSSGTNNMADAWIKSDPQKKGLKAKKLKDGTMAMAKSISSDLKKSFKGITPKELVCDISYELGGAIKKTKQVVNEYIDDITRIPNAK